MPNLLQTVIIAFVLLVFIGMASVDLYGVLRRPKKEQYSKRGFRPKVLVIVPCKGMDFELDKNLLSLKNQNYRDFDVVAVVDSENDVALKPIKKAGIRHILSSSDCERCSGKVKAIVTAIEKFRNYDIYAIADSDIRCNGSWLGELLSPLAQRSIGLSTMYPYFKSMGGFWSYVKSVWGLVGEGMMAREVTKFGWGGSLAFRKELLDKDSFQFLKNSDYSVSDDICLTMITKKKGLKIAYTASSQPVVNTKESLTTFWEWANRQTALSILGNRYNLYLGVPFYAAEALLILAGISFSVLISPLFLILLLHYAKNVFTVSRRIGSRYFAIAVITLLLPFIYAINLLTASRMRSITWRGSRYSL